MNEWMNECLFVDKNAILALLRYVKKEFKILLLDCLFVFRSMDFDHREKGRTGAGRVTSQQLQIQRRDRLIKLAKETSDISRVRTYWKPFWLVEPVSPSKPFGQIWVSIMSHGTQHRSKFPCSHARKKASSQLSSPPFVFLFLYKL